MANREKKIEIISMKNNGRLCLISHLDYLIDNIYRHLTFAFQFKSFLRFVTQDKGDPIGIMSETRSFVFKRIEDDQVKIFLFELFFSIYQLIFCFEGKSHYELAGFFEFTKLGSDMDVNIV